MSTQVFAAGGYRYIPAVFQYSGGVAAEPGHRLEHVRFADPVPLEQGFAAVAAHIRQAGRPLTAFAACELRSPEPFTEAGFKAFNEVYCRTLAAWGIYDGASNVNPVARSNVCPELDKPATPSFHAFAFTVEATDAVPSFVVAGSGEAPEGKGNYKDHIVAPGDTSPAGMRLKVRAVLGEMERRMAALGFGWREATAVQAYTVFDVHHVVADEIVRRGAARHGLTWHFCRPPVVGLDYEMDVRGIARESVIR